MARRRIENGVTREQLSSLSSRANRFRSTYFSVPYQEVLPPELRVIRDKRMRSPFVA